jgi:hypothetical protein
VKQDEAETKESFWPDDLFGAEAVTTPLAIMKEQASELSRRSRSRLRGEVVTSVTDSNRIRQTFYLMVPSLDNYRYELFEIEHGVLPYPVTVISDASSKAASAGTATIYHRAPELSSEADFVAWLRNLFGSEQTKKVIGSLYAQSGA